MKGKIRWLFLGLVLAGLTIAFPGCPGQGGDTSGHDTPAAYHRMPGRAAPHHSRGGGMSRHNRPHGHRRASHPARHR